MKGRWTFDMAGVLVMAALCMSADTGKAEAGDAGDLQPWQKRAVAYAAILSQAKWEPVTNGIPMRGKGEFAPGAAKTVVPYSNGGREGRKIGFDVNLRTFLAALENPRSVLYTTSLRDQRRNAAAFYGTVCSGLTSYALQLGMQIGSSWHGPQTRAGVALAEPQSAQGARVGDVLWNKGHVALVTRVTTAADGTVTHVRVEESAPPTTRTRNYTAALFEEFLATRKVTIFRITDYEAWRGENRAERFLFPNYALDAAPATINRTVLLDLGDWVPYYQDQPVFFSIMDRDNRGVKALVIQREGETIETIPLDGPTVVERAFSRTGNYTAHCVLKNDTPSQACEFSVCAIRVSPATQTVVLGEPWDIAFHTENLTAIHVHIGQPGDPDYDAPVAPHALWLNDEQRRQGRVTVPADVLDRTGTHSVIITAENRYGRLKGRQTVQVVAQKKKNTPDGA